jgi:Helix-turn-helix domain
MIVEGGLIGKTAKSVSSLGREGINMAATGTASTTEKGRRIVGTERQTLAKDLVKRYTSGESIRALAASTGRSYGFIHRVLTESGVQLRQRGGARRRKKA